MRYIFWGVAALCPIVLGAAAHADANHANDPYYEASHGLRFADLEFAMPRNPRLWSSDPRWEVHHTPARQLTSASEALHAAIPDGTPVAEAATRLRQAGAKCAAATATGLECRYNDVETPFGTDWDNVTWRVKLALGNGRVSGIIVSRDWTRR